MNPHPVPMPQIPGYTLTGVLGSGGMGTVYSGIDADRREVAIKVLHPGLSADFDVRARLRREVATLHRVKGAQVSQVLDAEVDAPEAFIVTELIHGETLAESVERAGPLDSGELADLATGLAAALSSIHRAGVVHRDLKPSNVMITNDGPVLIDFGISQILDDARLTRPGLVAGTPGYVDPVVLGGAGPDELGDWWGWAALLVFAVTGRPPFGASPTVAVQRSQAGLVDVDGVSPPIADALARALTPDPTGRLAPAQVIAIMDAVASGGQPPPLPVVAASEPPQVPPPLVPSPPPTAVLPPNAPVLPPTTTLPQAAGFPQQPVQHGQVPPVSYPVGAVNPWSAGRGEVVASWPDLPAPAPVVPPVPPRPRTLATLALWLALSAVALQVPGLALLLSVAGIILTSTLGSAGKELRKRRTWYGRRRRDIVVLLLASPVHVLRGSLKSSLGLLLGLFLGALAWLAIAPVNESYAAFGALAVVLAVFWWTPPSEFARDGARLLLGVGGGAGTGVWVILAGIVLVVMAVLANGSVVWDPLPEPPIGNFFSVS